MKIVIVLRVFAVMEIWSFRMLPNKFICYISFRKKAKTA